MAGTCGGEGRHGVNQWRGMFLDPQQTLPHGSNVLTLSSGHCFVQLLVCPACLLSHVRFFVTPWTVTHQAPLSMGFSRQEYWSGLSCPPPKELPSLGIKPRSLALQANSLLYEPPGKPKKYKRNEAASRISLLKDDYKENSSRSQLMFLTSDLHST